MLKASVLVFLSCLAAFAQTPPSPTFDAASVKPSDPNLGSQGFPIRGGPGTTDPGRIVYTNTSLKAMLYWAYGLPISQITAPPWMSAEKFDITATMPPGTTKEQFAVMLQNLLAQRFHLVVHHESKEVAGYEMIVGRNGPKLKKSSADDALAAVQPQSQAPVASFVPNGYPQLYRPGMIYPFLLGSNGKAIHLIAKAQLLSDLAKVLGGMVHGPIADNTGLTGRFDFTLDFDTGAPPAQAPSDTPENTAPDVPTALQEQLGLKLQPKKTQIDMLIVDSADKAPTEN